MIPVLYQQWYMEIQKIKKANDRKTLHRHRYVLKPKLVSLFFHTHQFSANGKAGLSLPTIGHRSLKPSITASQSPGTRLHHPYSKLVCHWGRKQREREATGATINMSSHSQSTWTAINKYSTVRCTRMTTAASSRKDSKV